LKKRVQKSEISKMYMEKLKIKTPAKLNLFLQITGKRPDGYHLINSLMQSIDLQDSLTFTKLKTIGGSIKIKTNYSPELLPFINSEFCAPDDPQKNIIGKVCRIIMDKYKIKNDISVSVHKKIPIGAGLGGGSANGAGAALALNTLFALNLSAAELCALTSEIGADIPFNIYRGTALVNGIGDKIQTIDCIFIKQFSFIIIYPNIQCSTKDVYKNYKFRLTSAKKYVNINPNIFIKGADLESLEKNCVNDLTIPAFRLYKGLNIIKTKIEQLTNKKVFMSGSGSTLFLIYYKKDTQQIENDCQILKRKLENCYIYNAKPI